MKVVCDVVVALQTFGIQGTLVVMMTNHTTRALCDGNVDSGDETINELVNDKTQVPHSSLVGTLVQYISTNYQTVFHQKLGKSDKGKCVVYIK